MPDAVAEGVQTFGALTDLERKTKAYNALNTAYGPAVAYDPENAFKAAKASAEIPLQPTAAKTSQAQAEANLQKSTLENQDTAGTQQRLAAYRATQMLKSVANPDGSIPPDAYDKIVRPNAALLGIDPAHVDAFGQTLSGPGGAQHLDTIAQALIGPTKVTGAVNYGTDAQGNPVAITKDQYGNIHQQPLGSTTPVQVTNAQSGQKRVGIAQQNANTNAFRANTTANNSTFGNPNGFAPQGALPGDNRPSANFDNAGKPTAKASVDLIGADGKPQIDPNSQFARLPPKGKQQAIGAATQIVNQATNLQSTNQILDTIDKQITPYTAGTGSLLSKLPGTAQKDLQANLKTLEAQGLTSWINSLKNSQGQTGIGRVLQSEAKAAMTLFGNMEQDQSAKQLQFHAQLFRRTVNNLYKHAREGFTSFYGVDPHTAIGEAQPEQALPQGWKYNGVVK